MGPSSRRSSCRPLILCQVICPLSRITWHILGIRCPTCIFAPPVGRHNKLHHELPILWWFGMKPRSQGRGKADVACAGTGGQVAWGSLNTAAALKKIAGMKPSSTQAGTPKPHSWFSLRHASSCKLLGTPTSANGRCLFAVLTGTIWQAQ